MRKKDIISCLKKEENDGNGEILEFKQDGILYYDYYYGNEVFYRSHRYCTKENLKSRIFIGESALNMGINHDLLKNVLYESFKDCFSDAFSTFRGCIVFSNKKELKKGISFCCKELDENMETLMEDFEYEDMDNFVGKLWYRKQIILINESLVRKIAIQESRSYNESFIEHYSRGILTTIIHEMRHCMFINIFLPENIYPKELESEYEVENFCIDAYENLNSSLKLINVPIEYIKTKKVCA